MPEQCEVLFIGGVFAKENEKEVIEQSKKCGIFCKPDADEID